MSLQRGGKRSLDLDKDLVLTRKISALLRPHGFMIQGIWVAILIFWMRFGDPERKEAGKKFFSEEFQLD